VLGYYLGDGFITKRSNGENSHLNFSEGHPKLIVRYTEICRDVFGITPLAANHRGGNSVVLSLYSREFADVVESMGVTGSALTKRVPGWVFDLADDLKFAFLRGYLDADGNFFVNEIRGIEYGSFGFESTNRSLIEDLRELAISAGLQVSNLSKRDGHGYTEGTSYRFFINEYSSVNHLLDSGEALKGARTRQYSLSDRSNELRKSWYWSRLHILDSKIFALERVLEIREDGKSMTYDVSMADSRDPNFIANGFVVHNSHPLRGRWKPRVTPADVTLNLGEKAPVPEVPAELRRWGKVVHDHESIWIARWIDKLTEKEKYVWPHESSDIQQSRNKEKYDKALKIGKELLKIRAATLKKMSSKDEKESKIATVCCLIDKLGMRVGDEKDEDEADTVGATTLRVEHIKIGVGAIEFDFLGKDSVRWVKLLENPETALVNNLRKFTAGKRPEAEIFDGINSSMVNRFLSNIVPGTTAKVFRTYHATNVTEVFLRSKDVRVADDLEKKYHVKIANLKAAVWCNHKRTPPKNWEESLKKKEQKLEEYKAKGKEERVRKMSMDIDLAKETKEYNLNTSLKNYIDPRVIKSWADSVGLDWKKIYTSSLLRKFEWAAKSRKPWEEAPVAPIPVIQKFKAEKESR
jgi:DNA topoisomerase-1